tara:strand:+ start:3252 stop:4043 length:792 start_codon:yes stop_codon:yes gene_type:complete
MENSLRISEIPNKSNLAIKKFQFSCDDRDETIPPPLPQVLNFCMGLIGKAGSGKTTLLLNLICKKNSKKSSGMYNKKFDKVYIFSPSLTTMKNNPFESIPDEQIFEEGLTEENLQSVLDEIEGTEEKVLLIMDDCVNDITKSTELQRLLCKTLMNRRHLTGEGGGVSVILTSQVYNKLPCAVRKCFSHLFLMNSKQRRELDSLYDEHILIGKPDFYKVLKCVFKEKRDFLFLDLQQPYDQMFYRNFNKLALSFDENNEESEDE